MRKISISEEVWQAIATKGRFGETEDDVLRRVFHLPGAEQASVRTGSPPGRGSKRFAEKVMRARVESGSLVIEFEDGARDAWTLPSRTDKEKIRNVKNKAIEFALSHGATDPGQTNAVRKALTEAGYHLMK